MSHPKKNNDYQPEQYWSELAERTMQSEIGIQAGDPEPYYDYKRSKFLSLFDTIDFTDKIVLEVGCGPGANLRELQKRNPRKIYATDISSAMINHTQPKYPNIEFSKTDGQKLNFSENFFDIVFTVTVLQHNSDTLKLNQLIDSMCRVAHHEIYLFERTEKREKGNALNVGRTISYYKDQFDRYGFELSHISYLDIQASYLLAGMTRKLFNSRQRKEGDPLSKVSIYLQKVLLPITKLIDPLIQQRRDLTMMSFTKK